MTVSAYVTEYAELQNGVLVEPGITHRLDDVVGVPDARVSDAFAPNTRYVRVVLVGGDGNIAFGVNPAADQFSAPAIEGEEYIRAVPAGSGFRVAFVPAAI